MISKATGYGDFSRMRRSYDHGGVVDPQRGREQSVLRDKDRCDICGKFKKGAELHSRTYTLLHGLSERSIVVGRVSRAIRKATDCRGFSRMRRSCDHGGVVGPQRAREQSPCFAIKIAAVHRKDPATAQRNCIHRHNVTGRGSVSRLLRSCSHQ